MFRQTPLKSATVALLLAAGVAYGLTAGYFGRELLIEVAILAILAMALDIVAGYGGMISLAHGALFGAGAYLFAIVTVLGGQGAALGMLSAVLGVAAFAWAIGAVTARTQGIFFIMATLAFGQMAYVWVFESPSFGGDDGMFGIPRLDLSFAGLDLSDSRTFALVAVGLAALSYCFAAWLMRSGFGRTLVGIRANEGRMRALGLSTWRHKAHAFGLSGALAGLAGALAAQHTQFISPGLLHWTVSGEALVVVILGGLGTLVGPVLGAAVFVFLRHGVQNLADVCSSVAPGLVESCSVFEYWHLFVGLVLIAVVMSGGRGLYGSLEDRLTRRHAHAPPAGVAAASPPPAERSHHA
jgi:branched-chain amino acid transport system permease protein